MQVKQDCFGGEWKSFVNQNSKAMFQTALLLTLNPQRAEDALVASIGDFDVSRPPRAEDQLMWERAVVNQSVRTPLVTSNEDAPLASPLLQPPLRPLAQLEQLPRISFVLRILLGYSSEACAQIIGVEECEVPSLIAEAATQLQQTVAAALFL